MRIDFYNVEVPDGHPALAQLLSRIDNLPDDESRTAEVGAVPFRMQQLSHSGRLWEGDAIRIRMNQIPVIASTAGEVSELDLDDDEGIGEETAFLFDSRTNSLVIQSNRRGLSAGTFARYVESITGCDGPVTPTIVLEQDVAARLGRVQAVRKFNIRFAGVKNPQLTVDDGTAHGTAIKLLSQSRTPVVEVSMSMGYQRGSLAVNSVKSAAARFLKWATGDGGDAEVSKIELVGTLDDNTTERFNLLEYRMKQEIEVEADSSRRLPYARRRSALRDAWNSRQVELETMFTEGG